MATTPTSLRIRTDLRAELDSYCERAGATKSRVLNLALAEWLGAASPPPVVYREHAPDDEPDAEAE